MEDKYLAGFNAIFDKLKTDGYYGLFKCKIYSLSMRQTGYIEEIHICEMNHKFSYFIVNIARFKVRFYFEDMGDTWKLYEGEDEFND